MQLFPPEYSHTDLMITLPRKDSESSNDELTAVAHGASLLEQRLTLVACDEGWLIVVTSGAETGVVEILVPRDRAQPVDILSDTRPSSQLRSWTDLFSRGQYAAAAAVAAKEVAATEGETQLPPGEQARRLHELARALFKMGQGRQSEQMLLRAISLVASESQQHAERYVRLLNDLADLSNRYFCQDEYGYLLTRRRLQEALHASESLLGPDNPETARILTNMARAYMAEFFGREAEPLLNRALQIREQAFGTDHIETAETLVELGRLHAARENDEEAWNCFQRARAILERHLGEDHPDVADLLCHMSDFLVYNRNDRDQAAPLIRQAMAIWERTTGLDHPLVREELAFVRKLLGTEETVSIGRATISHI